MKVVDHTTQEDVTKCLNALCLTINKVLSLWSVPKEKESLDFLLTRRLNQDPLENIFETIRKKGSNSDNPTPLQFTGHLKRFLTTI